MAARIPRAKYLVLMVLDGARPDYFNVGQLPHLDALRSAGTEYRDAFDGILEAETPAGHTTLATGSTPRRNGILGFSWAQNDNDYSLFSPDVVRAGAIEHIMERSHVPTLGGLYKARFPKAKVVALSGHKYYAADPLGGPSADAIMYFRGELGGKYGPTAIPGHVPPPGVLEAPGLTLPSFHLADGQDDGLATSLALVAFSSMRPRMLLINYPEFDWPLGHVYGGNRNPSKVTVLMRDFDADLGRIEDAYKKAHILRKTLFVVTADHGMAPISGYVPQTLITQAVTAAKTTAPTIGYSNGGYVWLRDASKAHTVASTIAKANNRGVQSVYYLSFVHGSHYVLAGGNLANPTVEAANQFLLNTLLNGHQPNVVVLCKRNASFASPSTHWRADHGGGSWHSQQIPLIFSGPGIHRGAVTYAPAQLFDVAPTVLRDMGVAPIGMEGHVLADALQQSSPQDQAGRRGELQHITPLVNGLLTQDRYEATRPD